MALATRCPHCNTTFRVAADQLKLRGGIVRCGSCHQIFDGNAALVESALPESPSEQLAAAAAPRASATAPQPDEVAGNDAGAVPNLDSFADALHNMLQAQAPHATDAHATPLAPDDPIDAQGLPVLSHQEPEHVSGPAPDPEPAPVIIEHVQAVALRDSGAVPAPLPAPDLEHGPLPLLRQASVTPYDVAAPAPTALPPVAKAAPRVRIAKAPKPAPPKPVEPENDEPQFVKQSRELERTGRARTIAMIAGSVALALILLIQGISTFRNVLVARFPGMSPALSSACAALGCRVELPAHIESLSIETGELQTMAPNTFSLITLLRNQSDLSQAWPHIELELTDATDKALVRRVFSPAEYLPPGTPAAQGFGARSEQSVKLYFELKQLKASGYHIAVFYP